MLKEKEYLCVWHSFKECYKQGKCKSFSKQNILWNFIQWEEQSNLTIEVATSSLQNYTPIYTYINRHREMSYHGYSFFLSTCSRTENKQSLKNKLSIFN